MSTSGNTTDSSASAALEASMLTASITVKDVRASLAWYRDVVGFGVFQEYEREGKLVGVSLKAGNVRILINQDDGARGWERAKGEGMSLMITTEQNIDGIADRIKAAGGTLASEPADMPWGPRAFRLVDPDGYKFVLSSPAW